MARITLSDDRGAVYVEFLLAFFPLFLMFLAICQLALVVAAEGVVRHSAYSAVRSAIVVLEDSPDKFDGAPRGSLSLGRPNTAQGAEVVLQKLGFVAEAVVETVTRLPQEGARMVPIQTAAFLTLLTVAPRTNAGTDSISASIVAATERQLPFALAYTRAATRVTLHDAPANVSLAVEPIERTANVTVRVSYVYHCTVPMVRMLMCRSLDSIANTNPQHPVERLKQLMNSSGRYKYLMAEATLPNQGAKYYARESSQ